MPELRCRVCAAGPSGQRLHKCPNSSYYIPGSDPGAEMLVPQRIQRKRTKGWRMPEGAIYVGRPTKWGNPIRITPEISTRPHEPTMYRVHGSPMDHHGGPAYCLLDVAQHFAAWFFECDLLNGRYPNYPSIDQIRAELAGHDLACWCPPRPVNRNGSVGQMNCHADVLLEIANGA